MSTKKYMLLKPQCENDFIAPPDAFVLKVDEACLVELISLVESIPANSLFLTSFFEGSWLNAYRDLDVLVGDEVKFVDDNPEDLEFVTPCEDLESTNVEVWPDGDISFKVTQKGAGDYFTSLVNIRQIKDALGLSLQDLGKKKTLVPPDTCPNCGDRAEQQDKSDIEDSGKIYSLKFCNSCGATWTAIFEMTGVTDLKVPA